MMCLKDKNHACYIKVVRKKEYWTCPTHGRQGKAGFWLATDKHGIQYILTDRPLRERKSK